MTMMTPTPRRPLLPKLQACLDEAHAALRAARDELRDAAARHAAHDPGAALALAQLAVGVDAVAARVPPRWPQPVTADMWLFEADGLHAAVTAARLGVWRLSSAADRDREPAPPAPAVLAVRADDPDLLGRAPRPGADGWTDPRDLWDLQEVPLFPGSPGWRRRAAVIEAANAWARECQARAEASGAAPLRDGSVELTGALDGIAAASLGVRATMAPGIQAKARIAARALVEADDASDDLAALARDHAAGLGPDALDALAWAAVGDLLAAARLG